MLFIKFLVQLSQLFHSKRVWHRWQIQRIAFATLRAVGTALVRSRELRWRWVSSVKPGCRVERLSKGKTFLNFKLSVFVCCFCFLPSSPLVTGVFTSHVFAKKLGQSTCNVDISRTWTSNGDQHIIAFCMVFPILSLQDTVVGVECWSQNFCTPLGSCSGVTLNLFFLLFVKSCFAEPMFLTSFKASFADFCLLYRNLFGALQVTVNLGHSLRLPCKGKRLLLATFVLTFNADLYHFLEIC